MSSPGSLTAFRTESVIFKWNTTDGTGLEEAKWGVYRRFENDIFPHFITASKNGLTYNPSLNNGLRWYKGRVFFVGNMTKGQAWFKITNLELNDTQEYGARIMESNFKTTKFPVQLTVGE